MNTQIKRLKVRSEVRNIRKVVSELLDFVIERTGIDVGFLPTVLSEAVTNAIVHGNSNDPEKEVFAKVLLKPGKVIFSVKDEGKGFNFRRQYDPTSSENLRKTHGRGLYFIRSFMDRVSFRHRGREIIMEKYLN